MKRLIFVLVTGLFVLSIADRVNANLVFLDDFEDGAITGWFTTGGGGTEGVEFVNESNWAFVYNPKSGKHSLSREFTYQPDNWLSFDMQLSANTGRGNYGETMHAASGVTISFESDFNLTLGEVSFCFATSDSMLPNNAFMVSNVPDSYKARFADWADLALVAPESNIADITIEFWAIGHTAQIPKGTIASARVRFDNVQVIPMPATIWLFTSGVIGIVGMRSRRKIRK